MRRKVQITFASLPPTPNSQGRKGAPCFLHHVVVGPRRYRLAREQRVNVRLGLKVKIPSRAELWAVSIQAIAGMIEGGKKARKQAMLVVQLTDRIHESVRAG